QLAIDVIDTGIGIPADKLDSVFEAFVQGDSSVTRRFGGTGLGLAISRRLAEMLGGRVSVRSELGKGCAFTATVATGCLDNVAILQPSSIAPEVGDLTEEPEPALRLAHTNILLVEDGATNRKLIGLILRRAGAIVTCADNGQAGVELCSREHFD